jgi:hypothetical protein
VAAARRVPLSDVRKLRAAPPRFGFVRLGANGERVQPRERHRAACAGPGHRQRAGVYLVDEWPTDQYGTWVNGVSSVARA